MTQIGAPLQVRVREAGGAHVVEVSGDLVVTRRDAVREAIEGIPAVAGHKVVVDASRLTHVDTACFALLVRLAEDLRTAGAVLVVAGLPTSFTTLARELRLEEALRFADSVERALAQDGV